MKTRTLAVELAAATLLTGAGCDNTHIPKTHEHPIRGSTLETKPHPQHAPSFSADRPKPDCTDITYTILENSKLDLPPAQIAHVGDTAIEIYNHANQYLTVQLGTVAAVHVEHGVPQAIWKIDGSIHPVVPSQLDLLPPFGDSQRYLSVSGVDEGAAAGVKATFCEIN
jgi:hypothetical protein